MVRYDSVERVFVSAKHDPRDSKAPFFEPKLSTLFVWRFFDVSRRVLVKIVLPIQGIFVNICEDICKRIFLYKEHLYIYLQYVNYYNDKNCIYIVDDVIITLVKLGIVIMPEKQTDLSNIISSKIRGFHHHSGVLDVKNLQRFSSTFPYCIVYSRTSSLLVPKISDLYKTRRKKVSFQSFSKVVILRRYICISFFFTFVFPRARPSRQKERQAQIATRDQSRWMKHTRCTRGSVIYGR